MPSPGATSERAGSVKWGKEIKSRDVNPESNSNSNNNNTNDNDNSGRGSTESGFHSAVWEEWLPSTWRPGRQTTVEGQCRLARAAGVPSPAIWGFARFKYPTNTPYPAGS